MDLRIYLLGLLAFLGFICLSARELEYYVSTEHLVITYYNPEYGFMNGSSARHGRYDYRYYVNFNFKPLKTMDNNVKVDLYFYEFHSNEYRRGMVEMHFGMCDLILKEELFFGPALRANLLSCPILPGEYHLYNLSIPDLPILETFPFRKGRIYMNNSHAGARVAEGYVDIEIKIKPRRSRKVPKNE